MSEPIIVLDNLRKVYGRTIAANDLTMAVPAGEIFGFGTVSVRPTNSALIRSAGGTLTFANGIQGAGGTVQVDAGSTLDLSGGASGTSADFLIHNGTTAGSLNLGANNITVGVDYTNASFGTGNTFNPHASVRAFCSYNTKTSDDQFTSHYDEINGGLGAALDIRF